MVDDNVLEIEIDMDAAASAFPPGAIFTVSGELTCYYVDDALLEWMAALVQIEEETAAEQEAEGPPYDAPKHPFYMDKDGDICDANGWLVMVTPYGVWPDTEHHAQTVLAALNSYPFPTPDEARDMRRAAIKQMMRDQGRMSY